MAKETFNYLTPQGGSGTGMMFPNWNARQLIMSGNSNDSATHIHEYTITQTGYIQGYCHLASGYRFVFVNEKVIVWASQEGDKSRVGTFLIPVLPGDRIAICTTAEYNSSDNATLHGATATIYWMPPTVQQTEQANWAAFPNYDSNKITTLANSIDLISELQTAFGSNLSYTATKNGWLRIEVDGGCKTEHFSSLTDNDEYKFDVLVNGKKVYRSNYSKSFYRNDDSGLIPISKGDIVTFYTDCTNSSQIVSTPLLGFKVTIDFLEARFQSNEVETGHNADNTAFYRKYPDGYIEQWGYKSVYANPDDTAYGGMMTDMISLPVAFSNANYSLVATAVNDISEIGIGGKSATEFGIKLQNASTTSSNVFVNWHACGY